MAAPETLEDIKADAKMMAAYLAYSKRRYTDNEVLFYFDKGNAAGIYPKYLDSKSSKAVNINSKVIREAKELADKDDFGNAKWKGIIEMGKKEVAKALSGDIGSFIDSPEYKSYLKKEKMGDPNKAAKVLGIKNVKKLTEAMEVAADGDKQEGQRLLGELAKSEKLIARAADMMKALEKAGLV
jgi:hypothetical protein